MSKKDLWSLAEATVNPFDAGSQMPIVIEATGRTFDTDRTVRVTREWCSEVDDEGDCQAGIHRWEGPLSEWMEAIREAAARPPFPPPGWQPGKIEDAARVE